MKTLRRAVVWMSTYFVEMQQLVESVDLDRGV